MLWLLASVPSLGGENTDGSKHVTQVGVSNKLLKWDQESGCDCVKEEETPQIKTCPFFSLFTVRCCSDCCLMLLSFGQTHQKYTADWICIFCAAVSVTSVERGTISQICLMCLRWIVFCSLSLCVLSSSCFLFFVWTFLVGNISRPFHLSHPICPPQKYLCCRENHPTKN